MEAVRDPASPGSIDDIEPVRNLLSLFDKPERMDDLVLRSWIFANGLATLLAAGNLVMDESEITRHLREPGGAFYRYAHNSGQ